MTIFRTTLLGIVLLLAACAQPEGTEQVFDPYEEMNRDTHDLNVAIDRKVLRPAATVYGDVVPDGPAGAINRFAANFSEPRNAINSLLQFEIERAVEASLRFAINSTIGLAGLFDPASELGIESNITDFGETLYVWGVEEGAYVELPFVGPSTVRHTTGRVADLFMNPLSYLIPAPESYAGTISSLAWTLDSRDEFAITFNDLLDNSADSYAQARILYLQNRRFKLGGVREDDITDPFEELGL